MTSHNKANGNAAEWPTAATDLMKKLREEGVSASGISKALAADGFTYSRNAVIGKAMRLKMASKNPPPAKVIRAPLPPRQVVAKATPRQPAGTTGPKTLDDRLPGECAFPMAENGAGITTFCCEPVKPGSAYCADCHGRVYVPLKSPMPLKVPRYARDAGSPDRVFGVAA
jgi:hypothetical protein